jgi:hypothetical protein
MDQPTIYSETVRESVKDVRRSAFGVRRHRVWERRLKAGAADFQKEQYVWPAEFFALSIYCSRNLQTLWGLLITEY